MYVVVCFLYKGELKVRELENIRVVKKSNCVDISEFKRNSQRICDDFSMQGKFII